MIDRVGAGPVTWIRLVHPSSEEIATIVNEYGVDPQIAHEAVGFSQEQLFIEKGRWVYGILHFPDFSGTGHSEQELDLLASSDILVTFEYETIAHVEEFAKIVSTKQSMGKAQASHGLTLMFDLLIHIVSRETSSAKAIANRIRAIEDDIFTGKGSKALGALATLNRHIIHIDTMTRERLDTLHTFNKWLVKAADHQDITIRLEGIERLMRSHERLTHAVSLTDRLLRELIAVTNNLLQNREYNVIRILTVVSCTLLIPTFIMDGSHALRLIRSGEITLEMIGWGFFTLVFFAIVLWFIFIAPRLHRSRK